MRCSVRKNRANSNSGGSNARNDQHPRRLGQSPYRQPRVAYGIGELSGEVGKEAGGEVGGGERGIWRRLLNADAAEILIGMPSLRLHTFRTVFLALACPFFLHLARLHTIRKCIRLTHDGPQRQCRVSDPEIAKLHQGA